MVYPLRKPRDTADRPEKPAPCGFARKMPICYVVLLGFVVQLRPSSRALHMSIFRVNAAHDGLTRRFPGSCGTQVPYEVYVYSFMRLLPQGIFGALPCKITSRTN